MLFILYLFVVYVSEKNAYINDILEVNSNDISYNDFKLISTIELHIGFLFPDNFSKKDEFLNNFKTNKAFNNHNIFNTFSENNNLENKKRNIDNSNTINNFNINSDLISNFNGTENDTYNDIFFNPTNMKKIKQTILNDKVLLGSEVTEENTNNNTYNVIIDNKLSKQNGYYDINPDYNKINNEYKNKYDKINILPYNFNNPPLYGSDGKKIYIGEVKNEEELQEYSRNYGLIGIIFNSQYDYTIKMHPMYELNEYYKPIFNKEFQPNEYVISEIKRYAFYQNLVDQAIIKTFTNYEYNINIYDQVMDQKEQILVFEDNPSNKFLPYLMLFFYMLVFITINIL